MRWKTAKPKHGEYRTITKFAWLPISFAGYVVWLECYHVVQIFDAEFGFGWLDDVKLFKAER